MVADKVDGTIRRDQSLVSGSQWAGIGDFARTIAGDPRAFVVWDSVPADVDWFLKFMAVAGMQALNGVA